MSNYFLHWQASLLVFMFLHDWMPGLHSKSIKGNGLMQKVMGSIENSMMVFIPLFLTLKHGPNFSYWIRMAIIGFYVVLALGTLTVCLKQHIKFLESIKIDQFLFKRDDCKALNIFHIILYAQIWICLFFALQL